MTTTSITAAQIDKRAVRRAFDRLGAGYLDAAQVQSEIGRRMLARLDLVRLTPLRVLDAGAGPGQVASVLAQRYGEAQVLALDLSWRQLRELPRPPAWQRWLGRHGGHASPLCADFERLPLPDRCVDLVVSNLALNWAVDLPVALRELHRVIRPGGLIMFTTLGPDTLREYRAAAAALAQGHRLPDMQDVGDLLVATGFSGPVMDQEHLTLTYSSAAAFRRDLRHWGAAGLASAARRGLSAPAELRTAPAGVSLEVVYGHAWKPADAPAAARRADGLSVIRFDRGLRR